MSGQRWTAVVREEVTEHVLRLRGHSAAADRFWAKVDLGFDADDCHVWTGALSSEGYGNFKLPMLGERQRVVRAHRIAWLWAKGEAPPEDRPFLDHVSCIGRFCVNVRHLEPVDNDENMRRMLAGPMLGAGPQRSLRDAELARRDAIRAASPWGGVF